MASGLLIIALLVFAVRGYFLSLPGVIARLLGLLCAYFVAFSFRSDLAALLASKIQSDVHPMLLQVISSAVLFFGTLFLVSLVILSLFRLLTRLAPALRGILSRDALGSRLGGAALNGTVGAVLVLVGLWVYGFTLGKNSEADALQRFANRFGDSAFALTRRLLDSQSPPDQTPQAVASTPSTSEDAPVASEEPEEVVTAIIRGTAEIRSEENPEKHVFIERYSAVTPKPKPEPLDLLGLGTTPEPEPSGDEKSLLQQLVGATDLKELLKRKDVQEIAGDPKVRQKALEILQSNPELLNDAAQNPKYRKLLEQLQQSGE